MLNSKRLKVMGIAAISVFALLSIGASAAILASKPSTNTVESSNVKKLRTQLTKLYSELKKSDKSCGIDQGLKSSVCGDNSLSMNEGKCSAARQTAIQNGVCKAASDVKQCVSNRMSANSLDDSLCKNSTDIRKKIADAIAEARSAGVSANEINQLLADLQKEFSVAAIEDNLAGLPVFQELQVPDPQSGYN